jgi:hypothetical protein
VELRESERIVEDGASKELQKIRLVVSKSIKEAIKVSCKPLALGYLSQCKIRSLRSISWDIGVKHLSP